MLLSEVCLSLAVSSHSKCSAKFLLAEVVDRWIQQREMWLGLLIVARGHWQRNP